MWCKLYRNNSKFYSIYSTKIEMQNGNADFQNFSLKNPKQCE